jgi:transcriptional regulator GlxA family with amidase domain
MPRRPLPRALVATLAAALALPVAAALTVDVAASSGSGAGADRTASAEPIPVAVVLTSGATMIDFAGPWEVFQDVMLGDPKDHASHRDGYRLYTVGESRLPIATSGGMKVVPDFTFADAPQPAIVVVGAQRGSDGLVPWLAKAHAKGATVMSVCTGAFKLAKTGLLDGRQATTHHDFYAPFRESFPKVRLVEGTRYVDSGDRLYTAGGLTSGIDLALHLVALQYGREIAERTAAYMEYQGEGWRHGGTQEPPRR